MKVCSEVKYIKYNKVVLQSTKYIDEVKETFSNFFNEVKEKVKGLEGFAIMIEEVKDIHSSDYSKPAVIIVLTFWNNKQDMDKYYKESKELSDLVKSVNPFFIQKPERLDYFVSEFAINM